MTSPTLTACTQKRGRRESAAMSLTNRPNRSPVCALDSLPRQSRYAKTANRSGEVVSRSRL